MVTSPAEIVRVWPVAAAVLPPSLYHLIVPSAVSAAPVTSTPPWYTWAVSTVSMALFLKMVPLEEEMAMEIAATPWSPFCPLMLLTYTHLAAAGAPPTVQR